MKIALVGEAWGSEEALWGKPFVGPSGRLLNEMLEAAGINRSECFVTNVFNFQPVRNDLASLCVPRDQANDFRGWGALSRGLYLRDEFKKEILRLTQELTEAKPNLVFALGGTASWALLGESGISSIRGTIGSSTLVPGLKVLPTYHPAAVLRDYSLRPVTILDLKKGKVESEYPDIRHPEYTIYHSPTISDLDGPYWDALTKSELLSTDIETALRQLTCIGFAPNAHTSYVVPFWKTPGGGSYWPTLAEEMYALDFVKRVLALPCPKLFQNGMYDMQILWAEYAIPVVNPLHDTMLLHHALQPESEKGLGFLGSVYTNAPSWKDMRSKGPKTIKRED